MSFQNLKRKNTKTKWTKDILTDETVEHKSRKVVFSPGQGGKVFQSVKGVRTIPFISIFLISRDFSFFMFCIVPKESAQFLC